METKYFVDFCTHNGETDGWNFKQTEKFDDLDSAKKAYHGKLNTYIQYGKLDFVMVILYDSYGNKKMSEYWDIRVAPEPEPEVAE